MIEEIQCSVQLNECSHGAPASGVSTGSRRVARDEAFPEPFGVSTPPHQGISRNGVKRVQVLSGAFITNPVLEGSGPFPSTLLNYSVVFEGRLRHLDVADFGLDFGCG